jgi:hypothetical protein
MAVTEPDCISDELWVAGEPVGIDGAGARQHPADRPLQAETRTLVSDWPLISGNSDSSTASTRSRLIAAKSMNLLCTISHRPRRNGWQFVC